MISFYASSTISHSFKGTTWAKHKYIKKENGRYIYFKKGDLQNKKAKNTLDAYKEFSEKINPALDNYRAAKKDLDIARKAQQENPSNKLYQENLKRANTRHSTALSEIVQLTRYAKNAGFLPESAGESFKSWDDGSNFDLLVKPEEPDKSGIGSKAAAALANAFKNKKPYFKHSAKGSTWEDHKYIKRIDGTYYYPDNYEGGRHLSNLGENSEEPTEDDNYEIKESDIQKLASEVVRGNFGNGEERKEALGQYYEQVQSLVNQMLKTGVGKVSISSTDETVSSYSEAGMKAINLMKDLVVSKNTAPTSKSINLDEVYSVYNKKK